MYPECSFPNHIIIVFFTLMKRVEQNTEINIRTEIRKTWPSSFGSSHLAGSAFTSRSAGASIRCTDSQSSSYGLWDVAKKGVLDHDTRWAEGRAWPGIDAESSASLYTGAKSHLGDRVLDKVEKESFITLPGKGGHSGLLPRKTLSPLGEDNEKFYSSGSKRAWSTRGHSSAGLVVR